MQYRNKQKGISLIELMIAMVVSLVLVAGVGTVYVSSKRTYQTRDQLSMMDETARVALLTLAKHLEHAGYRTKLGLSFEGIGGSGAFYVSGDPAPVKGACDSVDDNARSSLIASATSDRGSTSNGFFTPDIRGDAIAIRFIGDEALSTDVLHSTLPTCNEGGGVQDSLVYNAFHVDTDANTRDSSGNPVPILYLIGTNSNRFKQPLVNGVENIQFLYGIDADADENVDKYVNATSVTAAGEWQQVIAIRVGMLVRSLEPVFPSAEARSYQVLDFKADFDDRFQRSVYTTVINLRNTVDDLR